MTVQTVAFVHLGCSKNLVDAEIMGGHLEDNGFAVIENVDEADVVIINTCGFIREAKEESIAEIMDYIAHQSGRAHRQRLVVAGCLAQRYAQDLWEEIPEIDGMLGVNDLDHVASVVRASLAGDRPMQVDGDAPDSVIPALRRYRQTPQHYAYVKIAEGCSRRCQYCAIPIIRGDFRSQQIEIIMEDVARRVHDGAREINLIAQDVTMYGTDIGDLRFSDLLERLASGHPGVWFRILYAHPAGVQQELLDVMRAYDNICSYLDLPLQHISASVLASMGRPERPEITRDLLTKLRTEWPELSLRTTLMVGHPGETEADFRELIAFVEESVFDQIGVFAYSAEEGTPAAALPHPVKPEVAHDRQQALLRVAETATLRVRERWIGQVLPVMLEQPEGEGWLGRHQGQAPEVDGAVFVSGVCRAVPGDIVPVLIEAADEQDLLGQVMNRP